MSQLLICCSTVVWVIAGKDLLLFQVRSGKFCTKLVQAAAAIGRLGHNHNFRAYMTSQFSLTCMSTKKGNLLQLVTLAYKH